LRKNPVPSTGRCYVVFDDFEGAILSRVKQALLFKRAFHHGQQLLLGDERTEVETALSG
jgi:hypothetical protein